MPDLGPPPERPLFAPDDGRSRRPSAPASVTESWGVTDWAAEHPQGTWASGDRRDEEPRWPVGSDPVEPAREWATADGGEPPRHWLRLPLILGLLAVIAIVIAFLIAFQGGRSQSEGRGAPPPSPVAARAAVLPPG